MLETETFVQEIMRIVKDKARIAHYVNNEGCRHKKVWCERNRALENEMKCWVVRMWHRGVFLTESVIQQKARSLTHPPNRSVLSEIAL